MPTISFSLADLQNLVGRKFTSEQLEELAEYCKGEFDGCKEDEVSFSLDDTNLPYLWSVEGIARLIKGALGLQKGIPKLEISKSSYKIEVSENIKPIRPFIAGFVASEGKIDDYLLKQLVQLQEKFCEGYGRRRQKASVGLYSFKRIEFPVKYKAVSPDSVKFIPLEGNSEMSLRQILLQHPKGKDYAFILKDFSLYPILMDSKGKVLSFPPIINSNDTGKVEVGDSSLFFEVTGTDEDTILLAANIFAQALFERGFEISSVEVNYPNRKVVTPVMFNDSIKINEEDIEKLLGLRLTKLQVKKYLEMAGYEFKDFTVKIPPYRKDIMHPFDVIEDIAIMYGFRNIKPLKLESYTIGGTSEEVHFIDLVREAAVGLGFQEIFSAMLTNKHLLYDNMLVDDFGTVEIEKYMSETYSVVRSWLLPGLLEVLSKNKHAEYPQAIFEQGICTVRKPKVEDRQKIAIAISEDKADFTAAKQALDAIMRLLKLDYSVQQLDHKSFIAGRAASIIVKGKTVGMIGEVHPAVLQNWQLDVPVAAIELDLTELI